MINRREFLKNAGLGAAGFGFISTFPGLSCTSNANMPFVLPRSTPEEQGISSVSILKYLDSVAKSGQEFHSLMILRHGYVVAEGWWAPYSSEHRMQLYSASKSFTSTAIGFAATEGLLSVDDPVIKFFPDDLPDEISENLASLKVKHLLMMGVGHAKDSIMILEASPAGVRWEKTFLAQPVVFEPGSQFMYNSGASYMLSSIVKKVTGQSAHEYLRSRLYQPLDITEATWTENFEGVNMGASHLRIRTESLANFGQLYLQKGKWNGKQVVSEKWVAEATRKQINNGNNDSSWGYGYGYQFWLNPPGGFRADGAFGQFSMVLPEQDSVVAITSESLDTKTVMQIVWDELVPAMTSSILPENPEALQQLRTTMKELKYDPPKMETHSATADRISGKEFVLDKNEFNTKSVAFKFEADKCIFTLKEDGKTDIVITNGMNYWIRKGNLKPSAHSLFSLRRIDFDSIVAASATWQSENTLLLTWRLIETTHSDSLTCVFDGDNLTIKFQFSLARLRNQPDDRPDISGRMMA